MFLRAGLLSLALLLASRLLGLARESAQAAAFGATGAGDVAALMLGLPDWVAGVVASGGLAYVLLPFWAGQAPAAVAATQRRVGHGLLALGLGLALALGLAREPVLAALAAGLPPELRAPAARALLWSAVALPAALLASLWATRLQHQGDFLGLYAGHLVVNLCLVAALAAAGAGVAGAGWEDALAITGLGLLLAMLARLAWLAWRQRPWRAARMGAAMVPLPAAAVWAWAAAAAGLPLALPFAARSLASGGGEGALASFSYAWKLVELPLLLAVQLVGTLALGPIARALAAQQRGAPVDPALPIRRGFALAWTLACACAAGLLVAAPALAQLLFGWGRMAPEAVARLGEWAMAGAWSLLPQALATIALAVLAARSRLAPAVLAHGVALVVLLAAGAQDGGVLMLWLDAAFAGVAAMVLWAARADLQGRLPWRAIAAAAMALAVVAMAAPLLPAGMAWQLVAGGVAGVAVVGASWLASADLRAALAR